MSFRASEASLSLELDPAALAARGEAMMAFARSAFPIHRSLTGEGVRQTLQLLQQQWLADGAAQLRVREVPSGTQVLDWVVPKEWRVGEAWIKGPDGKIVVDVRDHNLHLLGYSTAIDATMPLADLEQHLYSLPEQPTLIPYRTSYYAKRWGFCLPHQQRQQLVEGDYRVLIDTSLEPGSLTYGEVFLPGRTEREILFSTHCCHPSLANDNLSGMAVMACLAHELARLAPQQRRYGYRFLFVPGTIGAITWLARNPEVVERVAHGLVVANLGDAGKLHYKRSRGGTLGGEGGWPVDQAVETAALDLGVEIAVEDFVPFGYDERQYCSPGFDLPVGSLSRTPWGRYPEYHTSADNLELLSSGQLAGSLQMVLAVCARLERVKHCRTKDGRGEPQLGRRGLYRTIGGDDQGRERELALLWVLSLSDGRRSIDQMAKRSGLGEAMIEQAVAALLAADLLEEV